MGILSWLVLGLVAGVLGKLLTPGRDVGGWILTIVLGIVGAFVGGYVGSLLGVGTVTGFNLMSVGLATVGAVIVLFIYGLISRR